MYFVLLKVGAYSPTYAEMFGNANGKPSYVELQYLKKRFFQSKGRSISVSCAATYSKDFQSFLIFLSSLRLWLNEVSPFLVCSFLTEGANRGPSLPLRLFCVLQWAASVYGLGEVLCIDDSCVKVEAQPYDSKSPSPKQAPCPRWKLSLRWGSS